MSLSSIKDTLIGVSPYAWMFSIVSIMLVLIGWYITYNNSLKVATRSESKSLIDAVAKLLNEISDLSLDYWVNKSALLNSNPFKRLGMKSPTGLTTPSAKVYVTAIHGKAIQINKYLEFLRARGFVISDSYFSQVMINATIDCEKSYRYSKTYRVSRAQDVSGASTDCIMHLYDAFQENHPPRISYSIRERIKALDDEIDAWYQGLYE